MAKTASIYAAALMAASSTGNVVSTVVYYSAYDIDHAQGIGIRFGHERWPAPYGNHQASVVEIRESWLNEQGYFKAGAR
jgi:hypothetical protein